MGGVFANPLPRPHPRVGTIASKVITNKIRAVEKRKRIAIVPFKTA
jgi:hypothetical protein